MGYLWIFQQCKLVNESWMIYCHDIAIKGHSHQSLNHWRTDDHIPHRHIVCFEHGTDGTLKIVRQEGVILNLLSPVASVIQCR